MTDIPHFAIPFRFKNVLGSQAAVVNEQDSYEEIYDSVHLIARYHKGDRVGLPDFGITDPTFSSPAVDRDRLKAELIEWEPRAQLDITSERNAADPLIERLLTDVL